MLMIATVMNSDNSSAITFAMFTSPIQSLDIRASASDPFHPNG